MTVLEKLVVAAVSDPEWSGMIPTRPDIEAGSSTCYAWSRKGESHYKNGQFTRK